MANKDYIGDGVYVRVEPYTSPAGDLVLTAETGIDTTAEIWVERKVWENLRRYAKAHLGWD